MTKTWESRVGKLLDDPYYVWAHKCPDSMHGGQPKVDWIACDVYGFFWMIEVKQLAAGRKSINYEGEITPGQREALTAVSDIGGYAFLAIGVGPRLYIFTWGRIQWLRQHEHPSLIPLNEASIVLEWMGPKQWTTLQNKQRFHKLWAMTPDLMVRDGRSASEPTPLIRTPHSRSSRKPERSPSISKLTGSIPTLEEVGWAQLEPSSSMRVVSRSSSDDSPNGGGMS